MEAASEVFEANFFRFIKARVYLDELTETYPMPRERGGALLVLCGQQSIHAASRSACV